MQYSTFFSSLALPVDDKSPHILNWCYEFKGLEQEDESIIIEADVR